MSSELAPPYIKKLAKFHNLTVWRVDGNFVRTNIDEEFTNFGQHFRFKAIPENEFWMDFEKAPGEQRYFIDHLLTEYRLMKKGLPYREALMAGDAVESRERAKSKLSKQAKTHDAHLSEIHLRHLTEYETPIKIWLVNGELIRDLYFIDFTEGGHDLVYPFVPPNEIWLDNDLEPSEREFVLLHELHERYHMSRRWKYPRAHRSSSRIEYYCRRNPKVIANKLSKELNRQPVV